MARRSSAAEIGRLALTALMCAVALWYCRYSHAQDKYSVPVHSGVAVTYQLTPHIDDPKRLNVVVSFDVEGSPEKVSIQMPVWSPGDYHVQNHARFVKDVTASSPGVTGPVKLPVTHPDDNSWDIVLNGAKHVDIQYTLPETSPGIFSDNVKLQQHFGFVNGPSALVYLVDHKDLPAQLSIAPPVGWTSTVPLKELKHGGVTVANSYIAPDYDTLADSPIVIGDSQGLKIYTFTQGGTDFKVVCFRHPERIRSVPDLLQVLKTIAHTEANLMGGMDTDHYSFVFDVDGFAAGLEHLNSFRIGLPANGPPAMFSSFIGHEFYHQWDVKRIRPAVLGPFDYIHPPQTHNLWFAEGVTEYYAQICSHRGGFTTAADLLRHFASSIARMNNNPAHKTVSAEEASMRVWEAGTSDGFGGLSYYDKGELIGLCLDLRIRAVTGGKESLDDVMRLLMKRHAPPLPGYGEDELRTTVNEVAGQDLSDLYNLAVRTTDDLPMDQLLAPFGLDASLMPVLNETQEQRNMREAWLEGKKL